MWTSDTSTTVKEYINGFLIDLCNFKLLLENWDLSLTFCDVYEKFEVFKIESNTYFKIKFIPSELQKN